MDFAWVSREGVCVATNAILILYCVLMCIYVHENFRKKQRTSPSGIWKQERMQMLA